MRACLAALLVTLCAGCAVLEKPQISDVAQGADSLTTAVGIYGYGAQEANPVIGGVVTNPFGMAAIAGLKFGLPILARQLPPAECRGAISVVTGLGFGAAANNIAVMAGAAGAGPFGIGVGLFTLIWSYHHSAKEECGVVE